jgi:hypothetical protein
MIRIMKRHTLARVSLLFLFPAVLHADPLADENARLRQQVQELKARNAALERACPAAAQLPQSAAPAAAATATPAVPAAAISAAAAPAPAAAAPVAATSAAPAADAPVVHHPLQIFGPGPASTTASAAAAPATPAAPAAPATPSDYSTTGCDRGFFSGPAGGKWQSSKAWRSLHRGMSQPEVEALLGIEHYNMSEPGSSDLHWQYGRCNSTYDGEVVFVNGKVSSYSAP